MSGLLAQANYARELLALLRVLSSIPRSLCRVTLVEELLFIPAVALRSLTQVWLESARATPGQCRGMEGHRVHSTSTRSAYPWRIRLSLEARR